MMTLLFYFNLLDRGYNISDFICYNTIYYDLFMLKNRINQQTH